MKVKNGEKEGVECDGLRVIGLKKTYFKKSFGRKSAGDVHAVRGIYLEIPDRELLCLLGHNGAGKSTLMKCMFGIYKMDEGEIIYEGQKVVIHDPLQALKLGIAMVHQELQPIPERSVAENIYVGRYPLKRLLGFSQ